MVLVLVGVQDIGPVLIEHGGDAGHQTTLVRTIDKQYGGITHVATSLNHRI